MPQVKEGGEEETMEVKLLLIRAGPFAMSCALALRQKGVKFEEVLEDLSARSDLLLRSNPVYKQVPVLIHNGKAVSQSLVILEYIEEAWPPSDTTPSLLPGSAYDRSLSRFWADFINNKFIETGLKLMKRFGEEHATARKEIVEQFITLEEGMRAIGSVGPYFLGQKMSLADLKLLLIRASPFAMSCALALRQKGVKFEEVLEDLDARSDLLLRSNPVYKQVPVLIHNGKPVSQSLVILEYIEEAWPPSDTTPSLLPGSAYDRSLSRFWANFINKKFIETGLKLMKRFGEEHSTAWKKSWSSL